MAGLRLLSAATFSGLELSNIIIIDILLNNIVDSLVLKVRANHGRLLSGPLNAPLLTFISNEIPRILHLAARIVNTACGIQMSREFR